MKSKPKAKPAISTLLVIRHDTQNLEHRVGDGFVEIPDRDGQAARLTFEEWYKFNEQVEKAIQATYSL